MYFLQFTKHYNPFKSKKYIIKLHTICIMIFLFLLLLLYFSLILRIFLSFCYFFAYFFFFLFNNTMNIFSVKYDKDWLYIFNQTEWVQEIEWESEWRAVLEPRRAFSHKLAKKTLQNVKWNQYLPATKYIK